MEQLTDLKAILYSKRANIYLLEMCRVLQKNGRVVFLAEGENETNRYWNIPIANSTCILLGNGTSITQAAVRMLSQAGVIIGFCGTGGTPLLSAQEIEWFMPQSEYRPTEYVQSWLSFWFDEEKRLRIAKNFQKSRADFIKQTWVKDKDLNEFISVIQEDLLKITSNYIYEVEHSNSTGDILLKEAFLTRQLYAFISQATGIKNFSRNHEAHDKANQFLNHGNYLAYGAAASVLWALGIPHGFAVLHGKTRRGALVFDVADIIKDGVILPMAFLCAKENYSNQEFRQHILLKFLEHKTTALMFNTVKNNSKFFKEDANITS